MRLIVAIALGLVLAGVVLAPLLAEWSSVASIPLYAAFSWICHQRPQRTWTLGGFPLAVCVRCLGLYVGGLSGAVAGWSFHRRLFLGSMVAFGVEWLVEAAGWVGPPALLRFASGVATGFFLVPAFWGNMERSSYVIHG